MPKAFLVASLILLGNVLFSQSKNQELDSAINISAKDTVIIEEQKEHSPRNATLYSAFLPGLGQAYNKKYWKIPVIYAAGGIIYYAFTVNNEWYIAYRDEAILRSNYPDSVTRFPNLRTVEQLANRRDYHRRWRDLNVIFAILLYAGNILDAHVDAHFYNFDISKDLSMNWQPTFFRDEERINTGLSITLNFK